MKPGAPPPFGAQLKALREAAGFTQQELAAISGLSVHAVSALERGHRRRPHADTVRALCFALDLTDATRDELSSSALPLPPTALLGRDADVQTLRKWLADRAARLITLTGPGGAGKTRLALELARGIADEGAMRVVFVPLAAIREAAMVAPAIVEALGLSDVTASDLPGRIRVACGGRPTLLVLDNFEQVLDAAGVIADLLTRVPPLTVLVTSRASLRVRGERQYTVGPLGCETEPDGVSPADLARAPALELFVERVRDVQPAFRLTPANGRTVTAICRRLDALPLALELAAPWIKVLTPEDLLGRLSDNVLLSAAGPRDLPERQQTMNATVAWSYHLLGPDEQQLFRRLGALSGRFSIESAGAVIGRGQQRPDSGDVVGAVAALMDKSLLLRAESSVQGRPLYRMLETVRAYAALELARAGEREEALEALARFCGGEASLAAEGLVGAEQIGWLHRVRDDLESYRAALAFLIERGRSVEAAEIVWRLHFFWVIRGRTAEGLRWSEQILSLPSLAAGAQSRVLAGAGALWYTRGELERAHGALTSAIDIADRHSDTSALVQAETVLGHVEHATGNLTRARDLFKRSVERFQALAVPWGAGHALNGMAAVALAAGDYDQAEQLLDQATTALQHSGPWFLALALYGRANLAVRRERPDDAIGFVRESLMWIRQLQDKFAFVYALVPLAAAAALKGKDAWAARILGVRDAVTERTGATVVDHSLGDLRAKAEGEARARLGSVRWARAYAAGRTASIDSLLTDIDGERR